MRRVIYAAATAFAAFALMTACDKAESGNGGSNGNVENPGDGGNTGGGSDVIGSIADIPGDYSGALTVTVTMGGQPGKPTTVENQAIAIAANQEVENSIDLTVSDFAFGDTSLGDIELTNIPVTEADGEYTFKTDEAQHISVGEAPSAFECDVTVTSGTVKANGEINMELSILAGNGAISVAVTFTGSKTAAE